MRIYINNECGNIHFSKREMLDEGAEMYDLDDTTNNLDWTEYYTELDV